MNDLQALFAESASRHTHLCPRQVLGVRTALAGASAIGLEVPRKDRRLLIIVETDGCYADGIEVATGSTVGRRTLRVEDYGKIAATFVDVKRQTAIRIAPRLDIRRMAWQYAPFEKRRYFAQLSAYQIMPDDALFDIRKVQLTTPLKQIISKPGYRMDCEICGEEIINQREIVKNGKTICRACAGPAYYVCVEDHR
jgi:formylmethanofuran dehydrogenase subunit E